MKHGMMGIFRRETTEEIELMVIGSEAPQTSSVTPPVHCSSRNSVTDGNGVSRGGSARKNVTPADSMEYINKIIFEKPWSGRTGSHG